MAGTHRLAWISTHSANGDGCSATTDCTGNASNTANATRVIATPNSCVSCVKSIASRQTRLISTLSWTTTQPTSIATSRGGSTVICAFMLTLSHVLVMAPPCRALLSRNYQPPNPTRDLPKHARTHPSHLRFPQSLQRQPETLRMVKDRRQNSQQTRSPLRQSGIIGLNCDPLH